MIRYQHVQHIDSDEAEGLLEGRCHIFPKLDGSNMCAYLENGEVHTMSRNQEIFIPEPFAIYVKEHPGIGQFLMTFPGLRLYGEWMVPHTIRNYIGDAWKHWFIFDVTAEDPNASYEYMTDEGIAKLEVSGRTYIPYEEYKPLLDMFGIESIPPIAVLDNPVMKQLGELADEKATFLMSSGSGEGIVIKRYDFVNKYGRTEWAKLLNSEYSKLRIRRCDPAEKSVEREIADRYVTPELVSKEYAKIMESGAEGNSVPGRLLTTVWYCLVTEYMWDAVKRYKNPKVDFKLLRKECDAAVKESRPEVFGLRLAEA